jgi:hypothetical protein
MNSPRVLSLLLVALSCSLAIAACGRSDLMDETTDNSGDDGGNNGDGAHGDGSNDGPFGDGQRPDSGKDGGDGGTGDGGPCTTANDCNDNNACTQDFCANGFCANRPKDEDNDGFVDSFCGGNDCNDNDPTVNPGAMEVCDNGVDDNCNMLVDCNDSQCVNSFICTTDGGRDGGFDASRDTGVDSCTSTEICDNGVDDNCNGEIDCADPACGGATNCSCGAQQENCTNNRDDNCNGKVDCIDPSCYADPACNCTGRQPGPEVCNDHIDNDCNGKVDCQDPACAASPDCSNCHPEICNDTIDNDCNGLIDCADPACSFSPSCPPTQEVCDNGKDDDHNGLTDCEDPACKTNPLCVLNHEFCNTALAISASGTWTGDTTGFVNRNTGSCGGAAGEAVFQLTLSAPSKVEIDTIGSQFDSLLYIRSGVCKTGHELACDDDTGGNHNAKITIPILYPGTYYIFVDGFTVDPRFGPDEGPYVLNVNLTANPPEVCNNGIDDDGDHFVDCGDPDCVSAPNCLNCNGGQPPSAEFGVGKCTDGKDNDCDGKIDCADDDCHASRYYVTECCNGVDDNGNGIIDEDSCKCASSATCTNGNFCFTDTDFTCNLDCTRIVGDICPFIASGATCSHTTRQCEYTGQ